MSEELFEAPLSWGGELAPAESTVVARGASPEDLTIDASVP
jgi:hypothetical protein